MHRDRHAPAGEALWDAGLIAQRPSPAEVLDLFTLMMQPGADVRTVRVNGVDWESAEAKRETRRRNRWRLFECETGQGSRGVG